MKYGKTWATHRILWQYFNGRTPALRYTYCSTSTRGLQYAY